MERKAKGYSTYRMEATDHGGPMRKNFPSVFKKADATLIEASKEESLSDMPIDEREEIVDISGAIAKGISIAKK
mgnify:CR=1 FL=1